MRVLFSPLNDRVLIKRDEAEEVSAGGIAIPDKAKVRPTRGQVVAVGPGRRGKDGNRLPMSVKSRDRVVFNRVAGSDIELDGETYLMVREEEILAVVG